VESPNDQDTPLVELVERITEVRPSASFSAELPNGIANALSRPRLNSFSVLCGTEHPPAYERRSIGRFIALVLDESYPFHEDAELSVGLRHWDRLNDRRGSLRIGRCTPNRCSTRIGTAFLSGLMIAPTACFNPRPNCSQRVSCGRPGPSRCSARRSCGAAVSVCAVHASASPRSASAPDCATRQMADHQPRCWQWDRRSGGQPEVGSRKEF